MQQQRAEIPHLGSVRAIYFSQLPSYHCTYCCPPIPSVAQSKQIRTKQHDCWAMHKWVFKWTNGCECTLKQEDYTNKEAINYFMAFRKDFFLFFLLIWNKQSYEGINAFPEIIPTLDPGSFWCRLLENKTMIMTHAGPVGGSSQN